MPSLFMYATDFLIWGALIALVLFFCDWSRRVRCRAKANFHALANKYNLKIATGQPGRGPCAEGELDNRFFRFSEIRENLGGQGTDLLWFELGTSPATLGFAFHLQEKTVGVSLTRELGEAAVTMGDPEFDQRWHADTNQPEKFRQVFSPEMRVLLDAATAASRWGEIRLLDGILSYREEASLDGPDIQARFDGLRKMLVELARAAEAAGGKST